jgi:hypothetical protein
MYYISITYPFNIHEALHLNTFTKEQALYKQAEHFCEYYQSHINSYSKKKDKTGLKKLKAKLKKHKLIKQQLKEDYPEEFL